MLQRAQCTRNKYKRYKLRIFKNHYENHLIDLRKVEKRILNKILHTGHIKRNINHVNFKTIV